MSGGCLVVLDRLGRDVKTYPLAEGLATIGSDAASDIRVMLPTVAPHHATVVVHDNQTVVRSVTSGETLVNGVGVSVCVLRHGDLLGVGGRTLRWEYDQNLPAPPEGASRKRMRGRRRSPAQPAPQRASMPASTGGKQVAIVQPQRRHTTNDLDSSQSSGSARSKNASGNASSNTSGNTSSHASGNANSNTSGNTSSHASGNANSNTSGNTSSHASGNANSNTSGNTSSHASGNANSNTSGNTSSHASGNANSNTSGNTSSHASGNANSNTSGNTSSHASGNANSNTSGNTSSHASGNANSNTSGNTSSHASGNANSNTSGNTSSHASGNANSNTSGNASSNRQRSSRNNDQESESENVDTTHRKSTPRASPRNTSFSDTKASLWIESRKTPRTVPRALPRAMPRATPRAMPRSAIARKSMPLRLAVLRRTQSAHKMRVTKIQAPSKIDHTKQAAIMLMTGHTPKAKQPSPKQRPSFVVTKPSSMRKSRGNVSGGSSLAVTPKRFSTRAAVRGTKGASGDKSIQSPMLPEPKKSALKNSSSKMSTRKLESIKFDLSNLDNPEDQPSDVVFVMDAKKDAEYESASEEDFVLHISERSPSPRRSIHSRSSRILEKSLGETYVESLISDRSVNPDSPRSKKTSSQTVLESPRQRKSSRGSLIVDKALENSLDSRYSRTSKSTIDQSYNTTNASTRKTMTRSPRSNNRNLESYSIVDLVSIDSTGTDQSVYGSAGSETSTAVFVTPGRSTRGKNSSLLSSSTPYVDKSQDSQTVTSASLRSRTSSPQVSVKSRKSKLSTAKSATITTPENTQTRNSINSTRISRASRSRSRINDSDIQLIDDDEASPKSSRRISKSTLASPIPRKTITLTDTPESVLNGTSTPENRHSPEEATTPVLSIQDFLDQSSLSQSSLSSQRSQRSQSRREANLKRKMIAGDGQPSKKFKLSFKSRSLNVTSRRSLRATTSSVDYMDLPQDASNDISHDDNVVTTPRSAVLPIQEGVKNKHSTAKKPQSKRYIIDNLDESEFVKQLFNSPVKRKLSQSMTEFSRKKSFEDDDDVRPRLTRRTIAFTGRIPENSFMEHTEAYTPDVFVRPLSTPGKSSNTTGLERHFDETPEKDLRNSIGVQNVLRSPRTRRSIKNDLTDVAGVKQVFARSPRNRLSDVRGVKELFKNKKSISNDLRNVSGVKSVLSVKSPKNDLSDVRGVKQLYRETNPKNKLSDVSGVEELFCESQDSQDSLYDVLVPVRHENQDLNTTFDQLIGKPPMRAYTKSKSFTKSVKPKQKRKTKSLHDSISMITENVEEWLQNELEKCVHKDKSTNKSNLTRELQKLTTNTVEGNAPILLSRSRNSTVTGSVNSENHERKKSASEIYSTHTLPIKKRSLVKVNRRSIVERLPIKKRKVLHSTPVKGRFSMTMNASELGRVSPIANVTAVDKIDGILRAELSKSTRIKTSQIDDQLEMITAEVISPKIAQKKSSPKRPPSNQPSPKVTRALRAGIKNKRRASLVITKKKPILSPNKASPKTEINVKNIEVIPRTTRSARQVKVNDKVKTPRNTRAKKTIANEKVGQDLESKSKKIVEPTTTQMSTLKEIPKNIRNTRARAGKTTVVVTKLSPQLKPKRTAQSKVQGQEVIKQEVKTRRRKVDVENIPDLTIEQNQSRRNKIAKNPSVTKTTTEKSTTKSIKQNINEQIPEDTKPKPNRRGKNVTFDVKLNTKTTTKRGIASKSVNAIAEAAGPSNRRNKKDIVEMTTVIPKTRKGKIAVLNEEITKTSSIDEAGIKTRRGVKSKTVSFKDDTTTISKGTSVQSENDGVKITRSKKSAGDTTNTGKKIAEGSVKSGTTDVVEEKPKRENKSLVQNTEIQPESTVRRRTRNVQSYNTKTRGKNNVSEDTNETEIAVAKRGSAQEDNREIAVGRRTRNMKKSNQSDEAVKGNKKNVPEHIKEITVGRRTRNVHKKDDSDEKKTLLKDKLEVETSSRGRRNKTVIEKESPVGNAKGKKTAEPEKQATKRGGRAKKIDIEESANKDTQPQPSIVPVRRKRKVDVDETTINEAPAKRLRATRATAALVETAVAGRGRSRRR